MKWKNILIVLSSGVVLLGLGVAVFFLWAMSQLPSAFEIKKAVTPPALQVSSAETPTASSPNPVVATELPDQGAVAAEKVVTPEQEKARLNQLVAKVLLEDFTDERKAMSNTCKNLASAKDSQLLKDAKNASAKYFFTTLGSEQQDPLVETAAPIFRYIFRAPGMRSFVDTVLQAQENNDTGLVKKTEFYYQLYKTAEYLHARSEEMNTLLQKSYNLHYLAKAVAQKAELAVDPAVVNFCEQIEKGLNEGTGYDADVAEKEMMKFFTDVGVDPASIGYNPQYRSKIKTNFTQSQISLNDTWIIELFARDIEKAHKEKNQ
ncbi:MAG: hypothetical protein HUU57_16115 [Bdellovibrio sp.]|nr:hypothetical protein [Bdellovibrio sp.]